MHGRQTCQKICSAKISSKVLVQIQICYRVLERRTAHVGVLVCGWIHRTANGHLCSWTAHFAGESASEHPRGE